MSNTSFCRLYLVDRLQSQQDIRSREVDCAQMAGSSMYTPACHVEHSQS